MPSLCLGGPSLETTTGISFCDSNATLIYFLFISWPYNSHPDGTFNQTESPIGDKYFADVFGDIVSGSKVF